MALKSINFFSWRNSLQNVLGWLKDANQTGEHVTKTNFIRKDGSTFAAKIKITPNFGNGKNNPQTGYCGITEVIDEEVNIPISFVTKIIKGVLLLELVLLQPHYFLYLLLVVIMRELETIYSALYHLL